MKHFELIFWISALLALAFTNPEVHHFSFCPLAGLGFSWCPGCGLGRSISSILHWELRQSISYHWFGIPAILILFHRIGVLLKNSFYISKT